MLSTQVPDVFETGHPGVPRRTNGIIAAATDLRDGLGDHSERRFTKLMGLTRVRAYRAKLMPDLPDDLFEKLLAACVLSSKAMAHVALALKRDAPHSARSVRNVPGYSSGSGDQTPDQKSVSGEGHSGSQIEGNLSRQPQGERREQRPDAGRRGEIDTRVLLAPRSRDCQ